MSTHKNHRSWQRAPATDEERGEMLLDIWNLLTGNGSPERGLLTRVAWVENRQRWIIGVLTAGLTAVVAEFIYLHGIR